MDYADFLRGDLWEIFQQIFFGIVGNADDGLRSMQSLALLPGMDEPFEATCKLFVGKIMDSDNIYGFRMGGNAIVGGMKNEWLFLIGEGQIAVSSDGKSDSTLLSQQVLRDVDGGANDVFCCVWIFIACDEVFLKLGEHHFQEVFPEDRHTT